jgi:hypothetical protein
MSTKPKTPKPAKPAAPTEFLMVRQDPTLVAAHASYCLCWPASGEDKGGSVTLVGHAWHKLPRAVATRLVHVPLSEMHPGGSKGYRPRFQIVSERELELLIAQERVRLEADAAEAAQRAAALSVAAHMAATPIAAGAVVVPTIGEPLRQTIERVERREGVTDR